VICQDSNSSPSSIGWKNVIKARQWTETSYHCSN